MLHALIEPVGTVALVVHLNAEDASEVGTNDVVWVLLGDEGFDILDGVRSLVECQPPRPVTFLLKNEDAAIRALFLCFIYAI